MCKCGLLWHLTCHNAFILQKYDHVHEALTCFAGKKCIAFFHEEARSVFASERKVSWRSGCISPWLVMHCTLSFRSLFQIMLFHILLMLPSLNLICMQFVSLRNKGKEITQLYYMIIMPFSHFFSVLSNWTRNSPGQGMILNMAIWNDQYLSRQRLLGLLENTLWKTGKRTNCCVISTGCLDEVLFRHQVEPRSWIFQNVSFPITQVKSL